LIALPNCNKTRFLVASKASPPGTNGIHTIYSSFFGSFTLGLISHYMARKKREPAIIFMVTGIIPLVPGGRLRRRAKPETMIFEIWSANNNPNAIAPAISVTSSDDVNVYNNKTREIVGN
jgi:hypothetical protein